MTLLFYHQYISNLLWKWSLSDTRTRLLVVSAQAADEACVVVIPSWRHHPIQYDHLAAALEALRIPTAVSPLPDGLWAFLLERLKVRWPLRWPTLVEMAY